MPPDTSEAENLLKQGWSLHVNGDHSGAEAAFRRALDLDAQLVDASFGLGLSLKAQGRLDLALAAFQRAASLLRGASNRGASSDRPRSGDANRGSMLYLLASAHVNYITSGDWNMREIK